MFIATIISFSVNAIPFGVETGVASIKYVDDFETYGLGVNVLGVTGFVRGLDFDYNPARAVLTPNEIQTISDDRIVVTTDYKSIINYDFLFNATDNVFFSSLYWQDTHDLTIQWMESILLAFVLYDFNVDYNEYCYYYGWFELTYGLHEKTGINEVYVSDSACDTLGRGMIAGTYNVIPEPSTTILAISGITLLFRRRRRPCLGSKLYNIYQ